MTPCCMAFGPAQKAVKCIQKGKEKADAFKYRAAKPFAAGNPQFGIAELKTVQSLDRLDGSYLNLECEWPNGKTGRILDDAQKYYACQVEISGSEKCYGVAANAHMIAVYRYGCNGTDAELILWKRLECII